MPRRLRLPWSRPQAQSHGASDGEHSNSDISNTRPSKEAEATSAATRDEVLAAAKGDVDRLLKVHQNDPNLPKEKLEALETAAKTGDPEAILEVDREFTDDSPYAEVRAAVRPTDGEEIANTLRAWVLGMLFVTVASGINMLLSLRMPAINLPTIVVQLLSYPMGCFWAKVVPSHEFNTFGIRWNPNPGPFTIKEHAIIVIMAAVSIDQAYATDALVALQAKTLYNINFGWGFAILFVVSSQLLGISASGMFRRFLVWPAAMVWPGQFANSALLYTLHDKRKPDASETNGWTISRYRWFVYLGTASFCWYWFPGVIWQGLSVFAFIVWIKPQNVVINQLFGGYTGLSLIPITFDWTVVSAYLLNPLLAPAFAHLNTLIGLIVFIVITTIGIAYTGALYSDYMPINTAITYDNSGGRYDVARVLTADNTFDEAKYKAYSPLFLPPTLALNYGLSFAALTACIVHIVLYHSKDVWNRYKASRAEEPDVHMRMMLKYKDVPEWWFMIAWGVSIALGLTTALAYPSQLAWWAFFVAIILALVFIIPSCMIMATTNIPLSLNILSPFLAGYMIPGKPIGVTLFKIYATITLGRTQKFSGDLKLAHYMKLPPRTTFTVQVVASIWASIVQVAVMNWALGNIDDLCSPMQKGRFTCPTGRAFFSSSIVWGVIGPDRMFGKGSIYESIYWYWLLGALLPVAFFALIKFFPSRKWLRLLNAPVMLGAMAWVPPATPLSFSTWAVVGLTFNWYIRKRFGGWWHNYNYITAAALDSGLILATIIIFCAILLPDVDGPKWWGNTIPFKTLDFKYQAIKTRLPKGQKFGPTEW